MFAVTNGMMMVVSAFFYMLMVGPANPFGLVSPVPGDGTTVGLVRPVAGAGLGGGRFLRWSL
jgi:hypothetical protein